MKRIIFSIVFLLEQIIVFAQSSQTLQLLKIKEDSMKVYANKIIQGTNSSDRFMADSLFTRCLVRALKIPNSFFYSFDSLHTISQLYAPDSSFKIFTWQLVINDNVIRQHGAIQMRTKDGSTKLFPLIDKSDVTKNMTDTVGNNLGWMGALYYKIILKKDKDKCIYTLLGYDEYSIRSNKKIIEILHFENNIPIFGGKYFTYAKDDISSKTTNRFIMEYKKDAGPKLNYDDELDMILVEHLISEEGTPNKKYTLVGDGDYEGFSWKDGKWFHINKVYNQITPEGKPPIPNPIKADDDGVLSAEKITHNKTASKNTKTKK